MHLPDRLHFLLKRHYTNDSLWLQAPLPRTLMMACQFCRGNLSRWVSEIIEGLMPFRFYILGLYETLPETLLCELTGASLHRPHGKLLPGGATAGALLSAASLPHCASSVGSTKPQLSVAKAWSGWPIITRWRDEKPYVCRLFWWLLPSGYKAHGWGRNYGKENCRWYCRVKTITASPVPRELCSFGSRNGKLQVIRHRCNDYQSCISVSTLSGPSRYYSHLYVNHSHRFGACITKHEYQTLRFVPARRNELLSRKISTTVEWSSQRGRVHHLGWWVSCS